MASSPHPTTNYPSSSLVESSGAVLFNPHHHTVCLLHYLATDQWMLAKGRRNCGESRADTAIREVREETGYQGYLLPITLDTRAPPPPLPGTEGGDEEEVHVADEVREVPELEGEPFMLTVRDMSTPASASASAPLEKNIKLIWWYIAALDEHAPVLEPAGEAAFQSQFFPYQEALQKLSFRADREVLERAIALVTK